MSISNYLELKLLAATWNSAAFNVTGNPFMSLHNGDPGETGANECTGGSYVRQQAAFSVPASGATHNTAAISYTGMPADTVRYAGAYDSAGGGNFLWGGQLSAAKTTNSGDTFQFASGDVVIGLD